MMRMNLKIGHITILLIVTMMQKDPSEIYFYFGDKKVTFNVRGAGTLYIHKNVAYTRENIAELIQEFEKN